MIHCVGCRRIEISGSARQCQQRHLRLSFPQQAPPRPRHTSAWGPSRPFTSMVTPKTRPEKRKHAIVVRVRSNRGGRRYGSAIRCGAGTKSAAVSAQIVRMPGLQARPLSGGTSIDSEILLTFKPLLSACRRVLPHFLAPVNGQVEQPIAVIHRLDAANRAGSRARHL
jgi:hypothetical protein